MCAEPDASSAGLTGWMRGDGSLTPAEQVVRPKRLLQQMHSQEELLHSRLETRVHNQTVGEQVSSLWKVDHIYQLVHHPRIADVIQLSVLGN